MAITTEPYDAIGRMAQAAGREAVRLVRIDELESCNRYLATQLELASDGSIGAIAGQPQMSVLNLAEPADAPGTLPAGTQAVALEAQGRWIVFVRQAPAAMFAARVVEPVGGAIYRVIEQQVGSGGMLCDKTSSLQIEATNLAELSLGPGGAVDDDTIVTVLAVQGGPDAPSSIRYVFDHPVYAKYLA